MSEKNQFSADIESRLKEKDQQILQEIEQLQQYFVELGTSSKFELEK